MELKKLTEEICKIFNAEKVEDLGEALLICCTNHDEDKYSKFAETVQDLSIDWLQKIYQYYQADRKEKMQDYTPKCLAEFVGRLTESETEQTVYDLCAGSGALTIQKWNQNHNLQFVCKEFDFNVIPYLLFNLASRNIKATVCHEDVLAKEIILVYEILPQEKYGKVVKK